MPEVPKLIGGALIAVGIGGAVATIAAGLNSTPLIIAVWLIALLVGIALIVYVEHTKRQSLIATETTNLAAIGTQDGPWDKADQSSNAVPSDSDPGSSQQEVEMVTSIELESRSPWEATPTVEISPIPPSHSRLLDGQSGGDYLIWTPRRPADAE